MKANSSYTFLNLVKVFFAVFMAISTLCVAQAPVTIPVAVKPAAKPSLPPIIITPVDKPYMLRSFLNFEGKKLTHVISVGYPNQINYSYNLKVGALLQVWKGGFLDVTQMWRERGEPQLAKPLGKVTVLSGTPVVAVLNDKDTAWPDTVSFDDLQNKGYNVLKDRSMVYRYIIKGVNVSDHVSLSQDKVSIVREITISNPGPNLYFKLGAGDIEVLSNDTYSFNKAYQLKIDSKYKPVIREGINERELIVPVTVKNNNLIYTITW